MQIDRQTCYGLGFVLAISVIALFISTYLPDAISPLLLAILAGLAIGNSLYPRMAAKMATGVAVAKKQVLRLAIVLYGFRLTFADVASVGLGALIIDVIMVFTTFFLTLWLARKWFAMDRQTAMLMGAGASICGAAAVLAADGVVKAPAHKVSVAVATVVLFGTLAIVVYPILYTMALWPFSESEFGIYIGASVHEVAQVVAAGGIIASQTADTAVITKMTRVMLLAPFLLVLAKMITQDPHRSDHAPTLAIPLFAIGFVVVVGLHSIPIWPQTLVRSIVWVDTVLLCMAMAALGLTTHFSDLKQVGLAPFKLGGVIFAWLVIGGGAVSWLIFAFINQFVGS